jgi:predicted O-linked N-acetylglucosamine transferase (SPINDLY family)
MDNNKLNAPENIPWDDPRFEIANTLYKDGDFPKAIAVYDEILSMYPDHPRALYSSGYLLHRILQSEEGVKRINKALFLKPDFARAYNGLGSLYMCSGKIAEAIQCYEKAVRLEPDFYQYYSNYLFCLECDIKASAEKRFNEALACAENHFKGIFQKTRFHNLIDRDKPLRIGLVSPDFGIHPVGMFLLPLLECNNRDKFKFICYSTNERQDDVNVILKNNSLLWRDISSLSDKESSDLLEFDRVDILIDLAGYTGQNRLKLFASRAAPVQITWLGYSSTTAVPAMDYIFTDAVAVLPDEDVFFTEKVIRFAPSRFCYLPVGTVPEVSQLPLLRKGHCTFGSFNNLAKITDDVVIIWSKILKATKCSRIILKSRFFEDDYVLNRYLDLFRQEGISEEQVELRQFSPHAEMLDEYADIDIALDPFPYCGGMTSCNALWMGVPVVTLDGDRPIGRQTKGFLELAGLPELIASTSEEYVTIAVDLASSPERLSDIRGTLRERLSSSPLCDPFSYARKFEDALRNIWINWCETQQPAKDYRWDDPRFDEAYGIFQTALNEGTVPEEAYKLYLKLLSDYPNHPRALHTLGVVLHNLGECDDGIAHVKRAILLKPDYAEAYNNLGNIYFEMKMFPEAEDCFRHFTELMPNNHVAFNNLARALLENGKRRESLIASKISIEIMPDYVDGLMTVGNALMALGETVKALEFTRNATKLVPGDSSIHTNLLYTMNFLAEVKQEDIYRESLRWGKRHADSKISRRPHLNSPNIGKKLRIGYVSGDFKIHPVSYHLIPVIEHHDRNNFEIYLYNTSNTSDEMTEWFQQHADHWRDVVRTPDHNLEEMIRVDGIDILVDLAGHTAFNRLGLFALKPAPVQASWIGYFNTTGMKAMDYLISDEITIPKGEERWIAEKVIRLPDGRFCYSPPPNMQMAVDYELPALKNGFVTFGSFNRLAKITRQTISLWSSALNAVQGSRLIIKTGAFKERSVAERIAGLFKEYGVESYRLDLRDDSSHLQMLEQYADIDIALDTFPFNGGATTCEALWMGVPVVTLSGHTPISRQSASLLASCGLAGFVAYNTDEFISKVNNLATDLESLASLRSAMREKITRSLLCDGRLFAANLESAYRDMWRCWCSTRKDLIRIPYSSKTSFGEYYNAAIDRMDEEDYHSAVVLFSYALRKNPVSAKALNDLGISLFNLGGGYYEHAANCLRKAISLNPLLGEAHKNLGIVLSEMKQARFYQEATKAFETTMVLLPDVPETYYMQANLKISFGYTKEALELFKVAISKSPDNAEFQTNAIFTMNYLSECSQEAILSESRLWDVRHGWKGPLFDFRGMRRNSAKLRIGYVSADLHRHPVGIFFQAVAVNHDRAFCEIFCYNNRKKPLTDEVSEVIRSKVEYWRDVNDLSDEELYALILSDKIDILVDLSGYTAGNRLKVFSRRAAPVQVSWLGYYNTTGISAIDYAISDETTVPIGFEKWYSEKVVRMPDSRFCFTPSYVCPDVEPLAALQKGRITFGSFNNFSKLTEDVIEAWSQIMLKVPKSRIILKWKNFTEKNIKGHYRLLFAMHGISGSRIEFRNVTSPFMMLDEYNDIDIALDPFPFTGGLTSCEALWMGVPVITFTASDRPASHQTAGFLHAIGLDELIAESLEGYIEKAVKLAGDITSLADMRAGLRQKFADSALCDGRGFTSNLEKIYRDIWDEWKTRE